MTLPHTDPAAARLLESLAPYARRTVERAAARARQMHAKELTTPHLLATLLEDEEAGATRIVLHAFADPSTIASEVLALCSGIMVVGSSQSLPFSVLGVRAVHEARALAADQGHARVDPTHVFRAAFERLTSDARAALAEVGYTGGAAVAATGPVELEPDEMPLRPGQDEGDALFHTYDNDARRALGRACRLAARLERAAISPAHLFLGCLEVDDELRKRTGLSGLRARTALTDGRDVDETPPEGPAIGFATELVELLERVPALGADTVAIFGTLLRHGSSELRALLERQKLNEVYFERVHEAFDDPATP